MFAPGGAEIAVILVIALIVLGPKKLPEIGKSLGQGLRELRKASREVTDAFSSMTDIDDTNSQSTRSNIEASKENERNAANSMDALGMGTGSDTPCDSAAFRCEETAGDREIDG